MPVTLRFRANFVYPGYFGQTLYSKMALSAGKGSAYPTADSQETC